MIQLNLLLLLPKRCSLINQALNALGHSTTVARVLST